MADHRFAHRLEGGGQLLEDFLFLDAQLVMARLVVVGDQVGVLEFVAAFATGILETDGEGQQGVRRPGFAQQPDQQAGIDATGQQHADVHGRPLAQRDGFTQRRQGALLPVLECVVLLVLTGAERQRPPALLLDPAIGLHA